MSYTSISWFQKAETNNHEIYMYLMLNVECWIHKSVNFWDLQVIMFGKYCTVHIFYIWEDIYMYM